MSRVLLLFIFSLMIFVESINGRTACGTPSTSEDELHQQRMDMYQKQMERYEEGSDRMGRINLECEPQGYGHGSGSSSNSVVGIIIILIILLFIIGAPIVICLACIRRNNAINAANLNNVNGQVVGAQMPSGTDLKPYPGTETAQKGDLNYQV